MSIAAGEFLWKTACEQMKSQEVLYLILTHHHSDHVFGMWVLRDKGAKVIAHETVREFLDHDEGRYKRFIMERYGLGFRGDEILGDVELSLPDQLIVSDTVLEIDGERIELLFTPGHVPSEISIYHPVSRTLFSGDTVYDGPIYAQLPHSDFDDYVRSLSLLCSLAPQAIKVLPSHGQTPLEPMFILKIAKAFQQVAQGGLEYWFKESPWGRVRVYQLGGFSLYLK